MAKYDDVAFRSTDVEAKTAGAKYNQENVLSRRPSAFQKPRNRLTTGLQQLRSLHNFEFQPPMPRPSRLHENIHTTANCNSFGTS